MKPYQSTNKAYSKFNQSRALSLWIIREGRLGEGRLSDFSIANFTPLTPSYCFEFENPRLYRLTLHFPTSNFFLGAPGAKIAKEGGLKNR